MNPWKMKLSASVASEDVGFRVQDSGFRVYIRPMAERGRSNAQVRLLYVYPTPTVGPVGPVKKLCAGGGENGGHRGR